MSLDGSFQGHSETIDRLSAVIMSADQKRGSSIDLMNVVSLSLEAPLDLIGNRTWG